MMYRPTTERNIGVIRTILKSHVMNNHSRNPFQNNVFKVMLEIQLCNELIDT